MPPKLKPRNGKKQKQSKGEGNEFERKQNNGATPTPPSVPNTPQQQKGPTISPEEQAKKREEEQRMAKDFAAKRSALAFSISAASNPVGNFFNSNSGRIDTTSVYVIQAGTVVPAVLINGLDTRMSGDVVAQIRQDVYDSQTGSHLLLPQGSKLIGSVQGGGGRRVGVSFSRIILPDGSNIALNNQRAVDKSGYSGLKDKYDTHEPDFYRGALISAVVGYLADAVDEHFDRRNTRNNSDSDAAESAMTKVTDNITNHIMQRASKTESPNAIIRPGFQFNVFINKDFNAYEYMR